MKIGWLSKVMLACLLSLIFESVHAWPVDTDWIPARLGGAAYTDDNTDFNNTFNLTSGPLDDQPSVYVYNDGSYFHVRFRIDSDPETNQGGLRSFGWGVLFDLDGIASSYEYMLMIDGITEELYIGKNTSPTLVGDPSDKAETIVWQEAASDTPPAGNYRSIVADTSTNGDPDYFLDVRVPYDVLKTALGIGDNDLVRFFFGTSASAQTLSKDLIGADLFVGLSDFTLPSGTQPTTATIRFVDSLTGTTDVTSFDVGEDIFVRVEDQDQNVSESSLETVTVTITTPSGDDLPITLNEISGQSGFFSAQITTNGDPINTGDSLLQANPIEIVTATYIDKNDGNYNFDIPQTDTIQVNPAADLGIAIAISNNTPSELDVITYTFTVTNNGPSTSLSSTLTLLMTQVPPGSSAAPGQANTGTTLDEMTVAFTSSPGNPASSDSYNPSTGVWNIGPILSGLNRTISFDVAVDAGTADDDISTSATLTNQSPADNVASNDSDIASISIEGADIVVTKTVSNSAPATGDVITYTITVDNLGSSNATGVNIADALPGGLINISDDGAGAYVGNIWTIGTVNVSDPHTLTITAQVSAASGTTVTNTAFVSANDKSDPVSSNNSASVAFTVGAVDLAVTKMVDNNTPDEGDTIIYTLVASNGGANAATGVTVTDQLPTGVSYVSDDSGGSYDDVTGIWTVGSLTAAGSSTLNITATVDNSTAGFVITNNATVTGTEVDADPGNNAASAALTVNSADLAITKTVDNAAPADGDTITFTIVVANGGPIDATGIVVTDYIPQYIVNLVETSNNGGTFNTSTGEWLVGALTNGATKTLVFTADVSVSQNDPDSFFNTATITAAAQGDSNNTNNSDSVVVKVDGLDLSLTKTVSPDATPAESDTIVYTITLTNLGLVNSATGVTVNDLLPSGVTYVSHTNVSGADNSFGTYSDATGDWAFANNDSLAPGATAVLTITATVDAGTNGQTITNATNISQVDQGDTDTTNDSASVDIVVGASDIQVSKTVDNPTPNEGDVITYTVTVTNNGPTGVSALTINDVVPTTPLTNITQSSISQGSYTIGSGDWVIGALANGAVATLVITAEVAAGQAGQTITNTASVAASSNTDPVPANNSSSVDVVVQLVDYSISKLADNATPLQYSNVVYTITVNNLGPDDATNVSVTETMPVGLVYFGDDAASHGYSYTQGNGSPDPGIWTIGSLAKYTSATLLLELTVTGTPDVNIQNTVTVSGDQVDNVTANNSASVTVTPFAVPNLQVTKTVDDPDNLVNSDQLLVYTIDISNTGGGEATSVIVEDDLGQYMSIAIDPFANGSPFLFTDGGTASGFDLGTPIESWQYSTDGGFNFIDPVSFPLGVGSCGFVWMSLTYDSCVTDILINMDTSNNMNPNSASFSIQYQMKVD